MRRCIVALMGCIYVIFFCTSPVTTVTEEQEQMTMEPVVIEVSNIDSVEGTEKDVSISDEEIRLIALVTMAEAEGECEEGQRLVIDTILNRMDSEHFPNTVYDVIYQPNQFSSMWNGRIDRCEVRDNIYNLVLEELECRMNEDVIFFTAGCYSDYGVPLFQVGNHCFSSYE